jgi:heme/copper-type cytochrome/quinol oxidase subunit 1
MNLSAPSTAVFWIAVVIVILAIIGALVPAIPILSQFAFWIAILGFVVLAGGCLMRGS